MSKSKHSHPELNGCAHESLKFCGKCDAVECTTCGFEWKNQPVSIITQPCYRPHVGESGWPAWPSWPYQPVISGPNTGADITPTITWYASTADEQDWAYKHGGCQ